MHCDLTIKQAARVAVSAGLSLALTLGSVPFFAYAETSDSIRAEMASVEAQLSTLYSEAEQCNYELQSVTAQLDKTNAEIDDLNVKIVETEEELVQAREDLSLTMSWSYRIRPDMISLILSSQSFEELVSNVYYANKVSSAQSEQIGHVKDLQEQQAQQKTDLETRKVEQEQLVADQQERADALAAATAELDSYYAGLSVELQEALAAEEAARQEAARKEAERRAAEEAAARAAAEAAAQNQNDNGGSSDSPAAPIPAAPIPAAPIPAALTAATVTITAPRPRRPPARPSWSIVPTASSALPTRGVAMCGRAAPRPRISPARASLTMRWAVRAGRAGLRASMPRWAAGSCIPPASWATATSSSTPMRAAIRAMWASTSAVARSSTPALARALPSMT